MPKAAALRHSRIFGSGFLFRHRFRLRADDRVLTPLPLFHSAGGVVATVATVLGGGSLVVLPRFSASAFWRACAETHATVVQYIGELCRYLVLAPPSPWDTRHRVRLAFGNGLRADVWGPFMERFRVREVGEFYASTEGNAGLFHHYTACPCAVDRWEKQRQQEQQQEQQQTQTGAADASPAPACPPQGECCARSRALGAVGHMGPLVRWLSGMALVRHRPHEAEPRRDARGRCEPCRAGEEGEMVAKVVPWDPVRSFAGYYGNSAGSRDKLLRGVFRPGDLYFRTGDLLVEDEHGYWRFRDRVGDTFRWKGENVSTHEVEQVAARFGNGVVDACVYGAAVPGQEGRACMVALRLESEGAETEQGTEEGAEEDGELRARLRQDPRLMALPKPVQDAVMRFPWTKLARYLRQELPPYAAPLFVRILPVQAVTGTFKYQKADLKKEGADPSLTHDLLLAAGTVAGKKECFVVLDAPLWAKVISGDAKL
jgi:acyl-CoA synthetase (AMP-forming)/AMP-acid ligase II